METGKMRSKVSEPIGQLLHWLDRTHLWLAGFVFLAANLIPCLILGEGSVFPINDQLDETILSYVLNAKYLGMGTEVFPELLGGINASGMQPSAVLFVPLYRIFPTFAAFLIQWAVVLASAFFGMFLFFGLTTHLVLIGYVVLALWGGAPSGQQRIHQPPGGAGQPVLGFFWDHEDCIFGKCAARGFFP